MEQTIKRFFNVVARIVMGTITVILVSASIYYSAAWHSYVGMDPWWAWGLAGAFIIFAVLCFDIGVGILSNLPERGLLGRGRKILSGVVFIVIWAGITVYSMFSTISGQYNQLLIAQSERDAESGVAIVDYRENMDKLSGLEERIQNLKAVVSLTPEQKSQIIDGIDSQVSDLQTEKNRIQNILDGIQTKEDRYKWSHTTADNQDRFDSLSTQISDLQKERQNIIAGNNVDYDAVSSLENQIELIQNENKTLREQHPEIVTAESGVDKGNIFQYFSSIFGLSPTLIQFLLSVFPAIFIDLISPISSVILFYGIPEYARKESLDYDQGFESGKAEAFAAIDKELQSRLNSAKL